MRPFASGLVLAAGGSTRLGRPKQLLPFRDTTLLGWVLTQVNAAVGLDEVVVVLGGAADEIRGRVELGRARAVENPAWGEGCSASYRAGLTALDPRAEAVVIVLGDQPGIESAVIDQVARAWRGGDARIVVADYRGRPGHPLLFARALFERLEGLQGDKAAWKLLDAHPTWVHRTAVDRPSPADVNTWEEYEAAIRAAATQR